MRAILLISFLLSSHLSALGRFPPIFGYQGQFGQDKWVIEDVFHFKKHGYFVDIGANNGYELSNTFILEKFLKWKGICIEANPMHYKALCNARGDSINLNVCLDYTNHVVEFRCDNNLFAGIVDQDTDNNIAHISPQLTELQRTGGIIRMVTKTLEQVLEECKAPHIIDFLSIDVEGAETRILKNFPFNTYTFLVVVIERPSEELHQILQRNGYVCVGHNPCDSYYIHKTIPNFDQIQKETSR